MKTTVITIDGPSSAGKSTIGLLFAQKIGFAFIDSGAIYRALCYYLASHQLPLDNEPQNAAIMRDIPLEFSILDGKQRVFSHGKDITEFLHVSPVRETVPIIAAQHLVREAVKLKQRELGLSKNTVMTGRDTGTEIFPDALLKFYFDATVEKRAARRYQEMHPSHSELTLEHVVQELKDRDYKDTHREFSPLRVPQEAIVLDTTNLTIAQVLEKLLDHYHTQFD